MRGTLGLVAALIGLLLGGGAVGATLAEVFAPDSWIAAAASFFALPLAFATGMQLWFGFALLSLLPRPLGRGRGGRVVAGAPPPASGAATPSIPGGFVFVPLSSAAGFAAGVVAGLVSPSHSLVLVLVVYWAVGTAHGVLAWQLARRGYLVPPESV